MKVRVDLFAIGRDPKPSKKSGKKHVLFITTFGDSVPKDSDGLYQEVDTTDVWIPGVLADLFRAGVKIPGEMEISDTFRSLKAFTWDGKKYCVGDNKEVSVEDYEEVENRNAVNAGNINRV